MHGRNFGLLKSPRTPTTSNFEKRSLARVGDDASFSDASKFTLGGKNDVPKLLGGSNKRLLDSAVRVARGSLELPFWSRTLNLSAVAIPLMPGSRTCKRPRIVPLNIHNGLVQRRRGTHNPPIALAVVSPRASPYDTTVPPRPSRWPGRTGSMLNYERVFSLKCDNLSSLDSGPLPFCFPVSEVPPPEDSHLASGGDSQPENVCSQISRVGGP